MAYQKQGFKDGNTLNASQLIKMEEGIIEAGGGSSPDLTIGLNFANIKVPSAGGLALTDLGLSDVSIEGGSLSSVKGKLLRGEAVTVVLNEVHFYGTNLWSRGLGVATHVTMSSDYEYSNSNYTRVDATFLLSNCPSATGAFKGNVSAYGVFFSFDLSTGEPCHYAATKLY